MKITKKKALIAMVCVLLCAWGVHVWRLARHWQNLYPTTYVEMTDTFEQNGLEFQLVEYQWTSIEELAERFGEVPKDLQELYDELFLEENDALSYLLVTFEYHNPTAEDSSYPAYDIILCSDMTGRSALYPFLRVCNEEGATLVGAQETTRYTNVYLVVEGEPPRYLVFGRDGGLLKVRIQEGVEIIDGKVVEA